MKLLYLHLKNNANLSRSNDKIAMYGCKLFILSALILSCSLASASNVKSTTVFVADSTLTSGLDQIHILESYTEPESENQTVVFVVKETLLFGLDELNIGTANDYLTNNKSKEGKTSSNKKKNIIKQTQNESKQAQPKTTFSPLPFSTNYPKGRYSSLVGAAVSAPATSSFSKLFNRTTIACAFHKQQNLVEITPKKTSFGYSSPIVAKIITVALSNRPPPFLG